MAEKQQIARVDRHPEMIDSAARGDDRCRDYVAPVEDRRGAVNEQHVDAVPDDVADPRRQLGDLVGAALLDDEPAAERRQSPLGDLSGLVENALFKAWQPRLHKADGEPPKRRYRQQRTPRNGHLDAL